eukprot:CAMPEP_0167768812 /NCGR_PEP_ID=MMETSP0110_2-20121227/16898_1 /TAXON_ID=629695 /ORGANISM="Gymnochlora sp., Strain CCMP2014" /LENGTH=61 /DNA_ID=CAMNT_0007657573 /DNA_START=247 /DNA_END=429 /DNA_ORIENTATION=-
MNELEEWKDARNLRALPEKTGYNVWPLRSMVDFLRDVDEDNDIPEKEHEAQIYFAALWDNW